MFPIFHWYKIYFSIITFSTDSSFPGGLDSKESASNTGDPGSVPGSGRSPGEGDGYSCLENSLDTGSCWAPVHGVTESDTTE